MSSIYVKNLTLFICLEKIMRNIFNIDRLLKIIKKEINIPIKRIYVSNLYFLIIL